MLNQIVLVGRIKEFLKIDDKCLIKIAVSRSFKNEEGEYETDLIPIMCNSGIAKNIMEFCKEEDVVGVKGRIQNNNDKIEIIAEKVTFLSSRKSED